MDPVTAAGALKSAYEMLKGAIFAGESIKDAELKMRVADMLTAVAEANASLIDAKNLLREKDVEIENLKAAFERRDTLVRYHDAYYNAVDGKPYGKPNCARCWDEDHKLRLLIIRGLGDHVCVVCKEIYRWDSTPVMPEAS